MALAALCSHRLTAPCGTSRRERASTCFALLRVSCRPTQLRATGTSGRREREGKGEAEAPKTAVGRRFGTRGSRSDCGGKGACAHSVSRMLNSNKENAEWRRCGNTDPPPKRFRCHGSSLHFACCTQEFVDRRASTASGLLPVSTDSPHSAWLS